MHNKILPIADQEVKRDAAEASAARMSAAYTEAPRMMKARLEKPAASTKMSAVFKQHKQTEKDKMKQNPQVGEVASLRHRILALSLFPNLFNRQFLVHHGATTE